MDGFSDRGPGLEVVAGELSGLRWFSVDRDGILSGSRGKWEPGENQAVCLSYRDYPPPHEIPVRDCGCGFWAYWALGDKRVYKGPYIIGIVNGYGKTTEGDDGFRCSHATIEALCLETWDETRALLLEVTYEVPVYSQLEAMLAMHPAPEGQPPLRDDYYAQLIKPVQRGGRQAGESPLDYARRSGFPVSPAPLPRYIGPPLPGDTALADLHKRRERWAGVSPGEVVYDELSSRALFSTSMDWNLQMKDLKEVRRREAATHSRLVSTMNGLAGAWDNLVQASDVLDDQVRKFFEELTRDPPEHEAP